MAEQKKQKQEKEQKPQKDVKPVKESRRPPENDNFDMLIRIYGKDIPGQRQLIVGLTHIKGISWSIANAICLTLKLPKTVKISDLTKEQIDSIEAFLQKPILFDFLKNSRRDFETRESKHILANELDMTRDFNIKRMKQIKSYKGIRHSFKQPVRGQRTRSHFRARGVAVGVKKKAK